MPVTIAKRPPMPNSSSRKTGPSQGVALSRQVSALARLSFEELRLRMADILDKPGRAEALLSDLDLLRGRIEESVPAEDSDGAADVVPGLIRSGQVVPSVAFCERLGWSKAALSKALGAKRVFYLESNSERFYPTFYADSRYERRHLEAVTRLLGDLPGGAKWLFFTTPKGSLSRKTPLQALADGQLADVKTAAEGFAAR